MAVPVQIPNPRLSITGLVPALVLAGAIAACGPRTDSRLANLSEGISQDSVMRIMGADSAQRTDAYLTGGQFISALYFPKEGAADSAGFADRNMSPVVLVGGKVVAWGWERWDSIAQANQIRVAPKPEN